MTFCHHKGGTGKTTSCLNIAGFCTLAGKKVLVVDCDPQANATAGLGIVPDPEKKNIYDVFMSRVEGFPQVPITDIICSSESGIDVAPATLDLVGAEPYLYGIASRAEVLKDALWPVKQRYDFILIDTPPSMGQFVINGLVAADHVIVTLDSGSFALAGVSPLLTIFGDIRESMGKNLSVDMAIISRWGEGGDLEPAVQEEETKKDLAGWLRSLFSPRHEPSEEEKRAEKERVKEHERLQGMLGEVEKKFADVHTVPYSPEVYEAQKRGLPLSHFAPDSSAGKAYRAIADEVIPWT
ncbi:ParA family protein [Methanoregula boonei]|uniref:ParA family protein n=1 Tax=Methanoregula boonei TaxID=358766 RepID=UPI002FBDAC74